MHAAHTLNYTQFEERKREWKKIRTNDVKNKTNTQTEHSFDGEKKTVGKKILFSTEHIHNISMAIILFNGEIVFDF